MMIFGLVIRLLLLCRKYEDLKLSVRGVRSEHEKRAEKSEMLLERIFDILPIGLWIADKDGKLIRGNPAGIKIWGAEPKVGMKDYGVFKARRLPSGKDIQPDDWALAHTVKEGVTIADEMIEIEAFDGKKKVLLNYTAPVLDGRGQIEGAVILNRDITEQVQFEEALKQGEERFRTLFEHMTSGVGIYQVIDGGKDFIVKDINAAGARLCKLRKEEMIGKKLLQAFPGLTDIGLFKMFQKVLATGKPAYLRDSFYRDDRMGLWIENFVYKLSESEIVSVFNDVTDRKLSQIKLEESEANYRTLFSSMTEGFCVHEVIRNEKGRITDYRILEANPSYQTITGINIDMAIGREASLLYGTGEAPFLDIYSRVVERHETARFESFFAPLQKHFRISVFSPGADRFVTVFEDITERIESEKRLLNATREWSASFDAMADGVSIHGPDCTILTVNKTLCEMLGMTAEDIVGKKCFRLFHGTDSPIAECPLERTKLTLQKEYVEIFEPTLNKWLAISTAPILDKDGCLIKIVHVLHDITERKKAEALIKESEQRYRSFIDLTGQVAWNTDKDGKVHDDMPGWRAFTGQSYEEIRGTGWSEALHPEDKDRTIGVWEKAVAEKKPYETEYRMRRHDGVYRHFLARGVPILDDRGEILEWIGVCIDMTDRKMYEQRIEEQQRLLRDIIDVMPAAVFWKDRNSVYVGCNKLIAKLAGFEKPEDLVGKTDYDMPWKKEESDQYRADDRHVMESGQPKLNIEETQRQADGTDKFLLTNKVPLRNQKGDVYGILGVYVDITRLKEMEGLLRKSQEALERTVLDLEEKNQRLRETQAQLLQSEKMAAVGQLSSGVAHEIKNPLAVIILAIQSLEELAQQDESMKTRLLIVKKAAEKANEVVTKLLKFAHISSGNFDILDIHKNLDSIMALIEHIAKLKKVKLTKEYGHEQLLARGDAVLLEQVFMNIVSNGIDAVAEAGEVRIRTRVEIEAEKKWAVIEMADNGTGIPPEQLSRIFEPFFTTKKPGEGTGLGLSTAYMIIEHHQGKIKVDSQVGQGTIFTVSLPLFDGQDSANS
ncbi:MAG TPA: PAS domain S-box protein [Candidatus Omnitrophota bacterium]|nr:PAS domain S-box protein [Candidatus Omnitrophota bacterium]